MRSAWLLLVVLWPAQLHGQAARDTTVTVRGIVKSGTEGSARWGLFLPTPVLARGLRFSWLPIAGEARGIANYQDRFVEAGGTLRIRTDSADALVATLLDPVLKEQDPPATVHRNVQLSYTQRATVSLAVEPARFAWHDSSGRASGVRPILLFGIVNHGDAPIRLFFERYEVFCVRVQSLQPAVVDTAWTIALPGVQNLNVLMGERYRQVIELPETAAPSPGGYRVRMELCAGRDYGAEMRFDVTG